MNGMITPLLVLSAALLSQDADPLPGTKPLEIQGDPAVAMVAGIDRTLMRDLAASAEGRKRFWKQDWSGADAYMRSVQPNQGRLRKIIGAVDPVKDGVAPEPLATLQFPAEVGRGQGYSVHAVRWPVFDGVYAEGLLLKPDEKEVARVVAIPDADVTPEQVAGLAGGIPRSAQYARRLAESGCLVLVPAILDRQDEGSGHPAVRFTNQPHREWVYRAAFELGRHVIGYEVQKVLAAVDWMSLYIGVEEPPIAVVGHGEGGLLALYAAAVDYRVTGAVVSGYFQEREGIWQEPIYRNVWGLLREFGDAELAAMIAPRALIVETGTGPAVEGPPEPREGRAGAAPGRLVPPPVESARREVERARPVFQRLGVADRLKLVIAPEDTAPGIGEEALSELLKTPRFKRTLKPAGDPARDQRPSFDPAVRPRRQLAQLVEHTQRVYRESEAAREKFWEKADRSSPEKFAETARAYRDHLWEEVIGKLPAPDRPPNPRTRRAYDEPAWRGHEVMLDVYPDVFAYGVLLVPKDLKPGERRPVVVCQHGLEGRPQDTIARQGPGFQYYKAFAAQLAERGFVVYAPQNPYIGGDAFRVLQRKANPLGLSIFSFIVRQHERTLEWLGGLPFVDPKRMGFYGLSYGGKTAVRVPTILADRYALSICSADFNEWILKNVSVSSGYSYLYTGEYEMPEFDLGNTFNYAELASLMVPRPFMVERGHDDGVAPDEWVAYEYAKVRRLYDKLGLGDRTAIEFFNGPHTIHGAGTFEFLHRHLGWPAPK
jgi:dienelactone hydrolase